jgi:hypothetical protein
MAPPSGLVRISPDQIALVAGLLARAFQDDPMMVAAFPDATRRARSLPRLNVLTVRYVVRYGEVYATPGMEGAALWLPPERARQCLGHAAHGGARIAADSKLGGVVAPGHA